MYPQSIKDVRINEIQVFNTDGFKDDFGRSVPWIELFNKGYGSVNLNGAYLKVKDRVYRIPFGDPRTVIPARGYMLFFAFGDPTRGTFYTNFDLKVSDYIVFCDPENVNKVIDSLYFNLADMKENVSYGWFEDHDHVEKLMNMPSTTPGASNNTLEKVHRSELFRQSDPYGWVITFTSIAVVAISLVLLYFIFNYMGKFFIRMTRKRKKTETDKQIPLTKNAKKEEKLLSSEELAAIAVALYKYSEDIHDNENTVLTINRAAKAYSPWSSKIYGVTQSFLRK
jgi:Na+-transporting methylmalonyl-CoA/oxaloacetate decarboxylase gamma subunit